MTEFLLAADIIRTSKTCARRVEIGELAVDVRCIGSYPRQTVCSNDAQWCAAAPSAGGGHGDGPLGAVAQSIRRVSADPRHGALKQLDLARCGGGRRNRSLNTTWSRGNRRQSSFGGSPCSMP